MLKMLFPSISSACRWFRRMFGEHPQRFAGSRPYRATRVLCGYDGVVFVGHVRRRCQPCVAHDEWKLVFRKMLGPFQTSHRMKNRLYQDLVLGFHFDIIPRMACAPCLLYVLGGMFMGQVVLKV